MGIENSVNTLHDLVERGWDRDPDPSFGVSSPNGTCSNKKQKVHGVEAGDKHKKMQC